ncbi:hypothetical protein [Nonomuraea wenchangensis]|uniref:hypothetical protein n=1 Tax=Nonomuraea wenchangensis TaxID=568860 RepID=UPI00331A1C2F
MARESTEAHHHSHDAISAVIHADLRGLLDIWLRAQLVQKAESFPAPGNYWFAV